MPGFISDSRLARELIRIGDEAIATEDDAKLRAYFRDDYVFHGPGGDLNFAELSAYFASLRAAFSNLRIAGIIYPCGLALVAVGIWLSGTMTRWLSGLLLIAAVASTASFLDVNSAQ